VTTLSRGAIVTTAALSIFVGAGVRATVPDAADNSIRQFLAQDDIQHPYRAVRRLEARAGDREGWLEARTAFSPQQGFTYEVIAEGGAGFIRDRILRAVLDGERDMIARGEVARSALAETNYLFCPRGVDADGLANVLLSPKRRDSVLVDGTLFLQTADGHPVKLEGRLAKSPSFWTKNVHILRTFASVGHVIMPVGLESNADLRWFGTGSLRMTYTYSEVDGHTVTP